MLGKAVAIAFLALCVAGARAEPASPPVAGRTSAARLLAGARQADGTWLAGVEIELSPHVVTYWRAPGEAGVPPSFDFSGSANLQSAEPLYPAPKHIEEAGSLVAGYDAKVVFPLLVTPKDGAAPVRLDLTLNYAACDKICLPARAHLALTLTPGETSPYAAEIARVAEALVPKRLSAAEARALFDVADAGEKGAWRLEYRGKGRLLDLFAEGPDPWFLEASRAGDGFKLTLYSAAGSRAAPKEPIDAVLTLITDQGSFEAPVALR